jgi:tRNA A-37 threonylcarbamoyl transferase component Bud32
VAADESVLTYEQVRLLDQWYPDRRVIADHSWDLARTHVLEVTTPDEHLIVKAAGPADREIAREIRAHRELLRPWTSIGRAPALLHADGRARLIATRYLPGKLVQGSTAEQRPETYRQAGELLALLHGQTAVTDLDHSRRERERTLHTLDKPHRLGSELERRTRGLVESWPNLPVVLVATHGDWQPRNWLDDNDTLSVIDFGHTDLRPAISDFVRLSSRQFQETPALESAFLEGYGTDPRDPAAWRRERIRQAIGTAVWAYEVGDEPFEIEGRRNLADLLGTS